MHQTTVKYRNKQAVKAQVHQYKRLIALPCDIRGHLAKYLLLISNFRCVLNAVCFLLGNSPASEFYMPTFRNTLSVPSS